MSSEEACPGTCNRHYREAREQFNQALAAYDPLDSAQSRPIPPSIQAWPGDPWCGRCKSRIRETLAELDDLAALLLATADGHRAGPAAPNGYPGPPRHVPVIRPPTTSRNSPRCSPDGKAAYRDLMDWPSLTRRGHLASAVTDVHRVAVRPPR